MPASQSIPRILKPQPRQLLIAILVIITFGGGYLFGSYRLRQCQTQNALLVQDLSHAVGRGVWFEGRYIRCKEGDK